MHPDGTEIDFRLQIQCNRSSSLVPVLFREVFSHPYISFFHLLVNGFSVIYITDTNPSTLPCSLARAGKKCCNLMFCTKYWLILAIIMKLGKHTCGWTQKQYFSH